jgi:predicted phosphodiesterase
MKIAILSDIHGNLPALEAVTADIEGWRPELILVNGDIVNGGPCSRACWQLVQEKEEGHGWQPLRGNHEDYVVEWADPQMPRQGPAFELSRLSYWTYGQLNGEVAALAALPDRFGYEAEDGSSLLVIHASIWGPRAGIYPATPEEEMRRKIAPYPTVFVTAHTHVPFMRQVGETLLINIGAVGLPGDGDWRASYGRLTWSRARGWQGEIRRVAYDREQAARDFVESGFLAEAGPGAALTLVELRAARDAKTKWTQAYGQRVREGQISMEEAVRQFLSGEEYQPYL